MCVTTWLKSNSGHTSTSRIYQIKSINQFFCVSFSVEQTNLKSNLCLSTCQQQQKKNRNRSFFFLLENPKFFSIDSLLITLITTIITVVSYLHKSLIFVKKIIIIIDVRKTNNQHNKMYPSDQANYHKIPKSNWSNWRKIFKYLSNQTNQTILVGWVK